MSEIIFDGEHFLSLSDDEVIKYAEPFVTTQADMVPDSAYEFLAGRLDQMSDVQTVYALELCMRLAPEDFASEAVKFLSHGDSAVCCTASRLLESLSPESVSNELVEQISKTPLVALFATRVQTGERTQIGTNEEFISKLLHRFNQSAD